MLAMNWPVLQQGSTGESVRSVQYLLNSQGAGLTVDGDFGPATANAVQTFQSNNGLGVDGIVGNQTWPALIVQVSAGSTGEAVSAVQSQLNSRSHSVAVTGNFGPETDSAVRFFQQDLGIAVDGVVGPQTWSALVSSFLSSPDVPTAAQNVFQAWTDADQGAAAKDATPQAVNALFSRTWQSSDGWTFDTCGVALGHVFCTWYAGTNKLVLGGNDNTGAPFYFIDSATFEP